MSIIIIYQTGKDSDNIGLTEKARLYKEFAVSKLGSK